VATTTLRRVSCAVSVSPLGHIPALSCAPDLRVADCLSMILRQMFPHAFEGALHAHTGLNTANVITGTLYLFTVNSVFTQIKINNILCLHFHGHFADGSRLANSWYHNVSILDFIGAKDDGGCGDNWSYKTCKASVILSPPTNQHPVTN